jgi:transposase
MYAALDKARLPAAPVNPRQVRDFARATGKLAKTDVLDAEVLAIFAERVRPTPRPLPDAEAEALSALLARRRQLIAMLVAERNRLSRAVDQETYQLGQNLFYRCCLSRSFPYNGGSPS